LVCNTAPIGPPRDLVGLATGLWPQAVIDRQRGDKAAPLLGPGLRQKQQSHAVDTTGDRDGDRRRYLERPKVVH
jgi:hypothetical protein